jgi:FkbM family methyltransferase
MSLHESHRPVVKTTMKRSIQRVLTALRLDVKRISFSDALIIKRRLRSDDFTFVQIGANDGISFDSLYSIVTRYKCRGLVVEPLADMYERLKYNYREYPKVTPVRTAVHPTLKRLVLHRPDPAKLAQLPAYAGGIASVDPKWHEKSGIPADAIVEEEVPAISLMDLLAKYDFQRLDLLQIDVEGFDAEVVKMIDFTRVRLGIIKYESFDANADTELERMLRSHGYDIRRSGHDVTAWTRR